MTKLVGILNLTPDSFSDGYPTLVAALEHYERLAREGADIVDIGAESTRPGAELLTHEEEWARLEPVLSPHLSWKVPVSVDTRHAATAAKALERGAKIINDVGGLRDPDMRKVLADANCPIIVMHSLGVPPDPKVTIKSDPVEIIMAWKLEIVTLCSDWNIDPDRLIFDPGIGFGKNAEQSKQLIQRASTLVGYGDNWLYGHSRKSYLGLAKTVTTPERDKATLPYSEQLIKAGVQYLRVHNIAMHKQLLEAK